MADPSAFLRAGTESCSSAEFECGSGQCVSSSVRCDGYPDCQDHSDEEGCVSQVECADHLHRCLNNEQCVLQEWLCDGEHDCKDMSDEQVTLVFTLCWGTVLLRTSDCSYQSFRVCVCVCRTVQSLQCIVGSFSGGVRLRLGVFLRAGTAMAPQTAATPAMRQDVSHNTTHSCLSEY